jgi:parvulin-like peptidyl-prolyl isomerase
MTLEVLGRRWLREPLVHFLIAGTLVFWLMSARPRELGERRIEVNEAVVTGLAQRFHASFRRAPSQAEIDGMIRDYVRDQVYYREALRLGLDQNDEVVIRRLRRKMESLAVADAEALEPDDAELQALIDQDPARYAKEARFSLDQIYLGAETDAVRKVADAALVRLREGGSSERLGAPTPLPAQIDSLPSGQIAGQYGDSFAASLETLPLGQWSGPVVSGFGLHLVKIKRREAAAPPKLADVRQRVTNDWRAAAVRKAEEDRFRDLLDGYEVTITMPGE